MKKSKAARTTADRKTKIFVLPDGETKPRSTDGRDDIQSLMHVRVDPATMLKIDSVSPEK